MKKIVVAFILVVLALMLFVGCAFAKPMASVYPLTAKVVEVDRVNDVVTCVDGADLLWQFTECDDWCVNDFVSILMNDNGTPDYIYDDIIEMVRYGGYFGE